MADLGHKETLRIAERMAGLSPRADIVLKTAGGKREGRTRRKVPLFHVPAFAVGQHPAGRPAVPSVKPTFWLDPPNLSERRLRVLYRLRSASVPTHRQSGARQKSA
jgi:hypothetical protein